MFQEGCPCGSGCQYVMCCGRMIEGGRRAQTPEMLMRSRYTAYTRSDIDYIQRTAAGDAGRVFCAQSAKRWASSVIWQSLSVLDVSSVDAFSREGTVTFEARYIEQGQLLTMTEKSWFERINGEWFYVAAEASSVSIE